MSPTIGNGLSDIKEMDTLQESIRMKTDQVTKTATAPSVDAILKPYKCQSEELSRERKRKALVMELEQWERGLTELENGTHRRYLERVQALEEIKSRRLQDAQTHYNLLDQNTMVVFKYECDEAEAEYSASREKLKNELLAELDVEIRRYKALIGGGKSKHSSRLRLSFYLLFITRQSARKIAQDDSNDP